MPPKNLDLDSSNYWVEWIDSCRYIIHHNKPIDQDEQNRLHVFEEFLKTIDTDL